MTSEKTNKFRKALKSCLEQTCQKRNFYCLPYRIEGFPCVSCLHSKGVPEITELIGDNESTAQ